MALVRTWQVQAWISDEIEDLPSGSQTKQARTLVVKNKDLQLGKSSNEMVFSSHVWLLEGHDKTNLPSKNFMDFRFAHQKGRQQNGGVEPVPCYSKNVSSTSCDMPSGGNTAHLFYGWSYIQVVWGMWGTHWCDPWNSYCAHRQGWRLTYPLVN